MIWPFLILGLLLVYVVAVVLHHKARNDYDRYWALYWEDLDERD